MEQTRHFPRVEVVVTNELPNSVNLPLFRNSVLSGPDGTSLQVDAFRSNFSSSIAPGSTSRGVLVFPDHLPDGPLQASLSFANVFEQGFSGPKSLTLKGIGLLAG